jgi:phosphohistidine swiveling domain-containing protein
MSDGFEPPGPGPWQQDEAHVPNGWSPLVAGVYPTGAMRGFAESFERWGCLFDTLAWGMVNGFPYQQPAPFDLPGPDGPPSHEFIESEIGRRAGVAAAAFETKLFKSILDLWDTEVKPDAVARHRALADVNLAELDHDELIGHVTACLEHVKDMSYTHHRFNCSALVPPADFVLHVAEWLHEPPPTFFGAFHGYSPASGVISPEMEPAVMALKGNEKVAGLLTGDGDPAERLEELRNAVPEVDEYVRSTGFRIVDGFDVINMTALECPEILLGRFAAGLAVDPGEAKARADAYGDALRERIPDDHKAEFDELLADGRTAYRLRDERGLYSDISAFGILRWAMLEVGRRLEASGRIHERDHVFELDSGGLMSLTGGSASPTADELSEMAARRRELVANGAPRYLGPPPPDPPPMDQLPPPLARAMSAIGFSIEGLLGQMDAPAGDDNCVIGIPGNGGVYEGKVCLVNSITDLLELEEGDVLVAPTTGEAFNSMIYLIGAIVTDHGSFVSHAAIVARECGIPAVVGCVNATKRLANGQRVSVDGSTGEVRILT